MAKIKKCKYKIERKNGINPNKDYFWLQDSKDKRNKSWAKQKKKYGFDSRELWNLDFVILAFIYPRLVRFKKLNPCTPCDLTEQEWNDILAEIIYGIELYIKKDEDSYDKEKEDIKNKAIEKSLDLLREYFFALWY